LKKKKRSREGGNLLGERRKTTVQEKPYIKLWRKVSKEGRRRGRGKTVNRSKRRSSPRTRELQGKKALRIKRRKGRKSRDRTAI